MSSTDIISKTMGQVSCNKALFLLQTVPDSGVALCQLIQCISKLQLVTDHSSKAHGNILKSELLQ